jgi:hypothetical protein
MCSGPFGGDVAHVSRYVKMGRFVLGDWRCIVEGRLPRPLVPVPMGAGGVAGDLIPPGLHPSPPPIWPTENEQGMERWLSLDQTDCGRRRDDQPAHRIGTLAVFVTLLSNAILQGLQSLGRRVLRKDYQLRMHADSHRWTEPHPKYLIPTPLKDWRTARSAPIVMAGLDPAIYRGTSAA